MGSIDIIKPLSTVLSSAANKSQQHLEKNSWEHRELYLGLWGEKHVCYLCVMYPLLLFDHVSQCAIVLLSLDLANHWWGENFDSGLGDEIDPAMMAALMATTALVARGASNEEVRLKIRLWIAVQCCCNAGLEGWEEHKSNLTFATYSRLA